MRWLVRVTAWERVSLWRRIPCAFGRVALLLALLIILGALLGPPLTTFFLVRSEARKIPWLDVVPQPLMDYSVSDAPGTTLSYFGYSFEVPWNATFKTKESTKNSATSGIVQIKFSSGQDLLFIAPTDQSGLLSEIAQELHIESSKLAFSDLIRRSAYDQYSALLNTSPSTVRPFGPRAEAARAQVLLMIKGIAMPSSLATGAFSFQFPNKRGFQIGDPRKSWHVNLKVLDLDGHYVEIICATRRDGARLTQPELNRILKSLHVVPAHSLTANAAAPRALRN
jgi:hypothetical protein